MSYQEKQRDLINSIMKSIEKNDSSRATIVEMRDDYEEDQAICLTTVVFIPPEIENIIQNKIIAPLREIDDTQYYLKPGSFHLTIKNLRTINNPPLFDDEHIKKAQEVMSVNIPKYDSFDFELKGLAKFPTSLSLVGYSSDALFNLVSNLDYELKQAGIPDNKKYASSEVYFGNITFCRFTSQPSEEFLKKYEELKDMYVGKLEVKEISLITANAVCSSGTKNIIATYKLK